VVNFESPSFEEWSFHLALIGLPMIVLLAPFAVLLHTWFQFRAEQQPFAGMDTITITGKNNEEKFELPFKNFIYAESQQNYVSVYYLKHGELKTIVIRNTMKEVNRQIRKAIRIHRSYIVNPLHLKKIKGNARKRFAIIRHVKKPVPVSASLSNSMLSNIGRQS